jgi:hypothetical protein
MFARVVEYTPILEKKDEAIKMVREELLPLLRKQPGFLDLLPLFPENTNEKFITIALWTGKTEAEKFAKEVFPKVAEMLKPFLTTPTAYTVRTYTVETTLCKHFVEALTAVA